MTEPYSTFIKEICDNMDDLESIMLSEISDRQIQTMIEFYLYGEFKKQNKRTKEAETKP